MTQYFSLQPRVLLEPARGASGRGAWGACARTADAGHRYIQYHERKSPAALNLPVSEFKEEPGAESRAGTGTEIENGAGVENDCDTEVQIKNVTGIEIRNTNSTKI
ncbi:hypothetical protein EVAR_59658_1 [Eumeta japonica]|uniref:Uncharacterized protein n=1 Tax=Eumeta variegata TaxID=151549 RepID=A0A4C1Z4A9_EUMVA|nr:hypothetical protein EVAR_59658_1 [Eumeta japonica]